jgi:ribosomal protein L40E
MSIQARQSEEVLFELTGRRVCQECGATYIEYTGREDKYGRAVYICHKCVGELPISQRSIERRNHAGANVWTWRVPILAKER